MATVTVTSACNTELSRTFAYRNTDTHLRDASFSSYLNRGEENFVRKLAESTRSLSPLITTTLEPPSLINLGRKKTEDGEISVFSAEKYFNGRMDEDKPRITSKSDRKQLQKKDDKVVLSPLMKLNVKPGTPSASSEASWNSQSALLPSLVRNLSVSKQNKVHGKGFFTSLGCNCTCSDMKSVDIDEPVGEINYKKNDAFAKEPNKIDQNSFNLVQIKQSPAPESIPKEEIHCKKIDEVGVGLKRGECFTFPVLNSILENPTVGKQIQECKEDEKPRKSLEVFDSSTMVETEDMASNLERRLTMLDWDATPKMEDLPVISGSGGTYDDTESDASSDLFEINSLSGNAHPFFNRQASDGMSSCVTPTTIYEPSEASIEWSVVTASAANFSVAASDYDEQRSEAVTINPKGVILTSKTTTKTITKTTTAKTAMDKEAQRRRPSSLLLGCRNHKAVKVAGDAYMVNEKAKSNTRRRHRSDSFAPMARFQAETKVTDLNPAHARQVFPSHSFPRLHSAHAPNFLYMQ